jgi:integrase
MQRPERLTAKFVENVKPLATRMEYSDHSGLYLVVQPGPHGNKSWALRYRHSGKSRKLTLGRAVSPKPGEVVTEPVLGGPLTLAAARALAAEELRKLELGRDPAAERMAEKRAAIKTAPPPEPERDSVEALAKRFLLKHAAKKRARTEQLYSAIMNNIVLPAWKGRTVHEIKRRDVIDLIEAVAEDRPSYANRTHAVVRKFFGWLVGRDVIESNPCIGVERPAKENARDRVLDDRELRAVLLTCDNLGTFGDVVKVMALTGTRKGEAAGMRWDEIKDGVWILPPPRTKNGKEHAIPLSPQVLKILDARPSNSEYVFFDGGNANFGRHKSKLDAATSPPIASWRLHDLRRTCASGMAKLGVALPVIEKCLNHTSGSFAGIVSVYQRHSFAEEKRKAFALWGAHVEKLVRG